MKANDEIVSAFHGFSAAMRMDLMCRLFHQCMPLEIRFLETVLHELGLKSYDTLIPLENKVNRLDDFGRLNSIQEDPHKVCVALALLRNENHAVATLLLRLLSADIVMAECQKIGNLEHLEEYRLMYVMAMNHPAFRFEDKLQVLNARSRELEKLLDEKMTLWRTQGEAAGAESIMIKGPQVLPMPPEDAKLQSCEVTGAYKRISDKRFVYSIIVSWRDGTRYTIYRPYGEFFTFQSKLLDLFPDEAGGKNKRARVIPFLPGKRFPFSSINSKEKAEKRFPEIVKYVRALMSLPSYITGHSHVRNFFKPHPQDHLLEETLFEKVKAVFDGVMDADYASGTDRRSCTLSHESPPSKTSKDRSKTFPSSTMAEQFLIAGRRIIPGTTTVEFTSNPLSPGNVPVGTPVSPSGPVHEGNGVALSEDGHFHEGLPSIPEKQGYPQERTDPSLLNSTNMLTNSTPNMDSGVNTMSSMNTPSITTRGVSSETTSTVSSMTSTPATSPLMTPDMKKRSESCLTINTDAQFSEESFVHWLKSHRLHKYAAIFRGKTLEEILAMQGQDLRKGGMTAGALNKFQKKINEWRTHLAHSNPSSLQLTISRHPSTFSLPSYLVDRGAGVLGSVSSLEQTPTSLHRRRIASTTSSTSDVAVMDNPIPEIPTLQSQGGTGEVESTAVQQKSVTFKDDETSLDCNSETVDTYPKVPSQSLPPEGVPVPDPSWSGPAGYYPTAGIPVYAGKQFTPTVQIQLGNGTTSTMNGQGQLDGVHTMGIPHQRNLPQPLQGAYGYYPRAIPVNSGHLLRMPTLSTPNGTYIMLPQQQQFFSRPFAAAPVVGGGFSGNQMPTCFKCGQYGHQGQECTSEGMDSYGGFHKPLGQQGSHLLPNTSQTDHPSGVDPV